jgi:hypothetical protein
MSEDKSVAPFVPREHDPADDEPGLDDLFGLGDDFDDEEFFAAWEEADAGAVEVLREALPECLAATPPAGELRAAAERIRAGIAGGTVPYSYIRGAAGWSAKFPEDDLDLWVEATCSLIAGVDDFPMPIEQQTTIMALQHGDWAGAVIGLIRAGAGAPAGAEDLVGYADACPEIEGEADPEDVAIIEEGFGHLVDLWEATGAIDAHGRLTELGWWGLPRALAWAWDGDFDTAD